jgi:hypothetical protein
MPASGRVDGTGEADRARPRTYTFAALPKEAIEGMSGKAVLQAAIDGELQAPISEHTSFWLVEVGDGFAAFEGETGAHLLNPAGTVHGGWALMLIDSACGWRGSHPAALEARLRQASIRPILTGTSNSPGGCRRGGEDRATQARYRSCTSDSLSRPSGSNRCCRLDKTAQRVVAPPVIPSMIRQPHRALHRQPPLRQAYA